MVDAARVYAAVLVLLTATPMAAAFVEPGTELRARALRLYQQEQASRQPLARAPHAAARQALQQCENAVRARSGIAQACGDADARVRACLQHVEAWRRERDEVLALIDSQAASAQEPIGEQYTPRTSTLRGVGTGPTPAQLWNDTVKGLRGLELRGCPQQLPSSSSTPAEVLGGAGREGGRPGGKARATEQVAGSFASTAADLQQEADDPGARDSRLREQAARDLEAASAQQRIDRLNNTMQAAAPGLLNQGPAESPTAALQRSLATTRQAAGAAAPMGAGSTAAGAASGAAGAGGFSSRCVRNAHFIENQAERMGMRLPTGASLGQQQVTRLHLQLWSPCVATDPAARGHYDANAQDLATTQRYCAGGCPQWTVEQETMGPAYLMWKTQETMQALADPGYSRELGPLAGEVQAAGAAPPAPAAPAPTGASQSACAASLAEHDAYVNGLLQRRPPDVSLLAEFRTTLHHMGRLISLLEGRCAGQPQAAQLPSARNIYDTALRGCLASATSPSSCEPGLGW